MKWSAETQNAYTFGSKYLSCNVQGLNCQVFRKPIWCKDAGRRGLQASADNTFSMGQSAEIRSAYTFGIKCLHCSVQSLNGLVFKKRVGRTEAERRAPQASADNKFSSRRNTGVQSASLLGVKHLSCWVQSVKGLVFNKEQLHATTPGEEVRNTENVQIRTYVYLYIYTHIYACRDTAAHAYIYMCISVYIIYIHISIHM